MKKRNILCYLLLLTLPFLDCRKPYTPKLIQLNNNYLVVGGIVNTSPNSVTTIYLSRTLNLTDSNTNLPELNAKITIESKNGDLYPLTQQGDSGRYITDTLTLDNNDQFRLNIATTDGDSFQSDFVSARQTGPIDSLNWLQDDDLTIYVNAHDPNDSSKYYWWDYTETWEYHSSLLTAYGVDANGIIYGLPVDSLLQVCYTNHVSTDLLLGTSGSLSRDVISMQPLLTIPNKDSRLYYRYSILVDQYALTGAAYNYWQTIKTNSQQLGTLFDPQPSQLTGNIRSLKNPAEPVVGYASAAIRQQKRIFISHDQLTNWDFNPTADYSCDTRVIYMNPDPPFYYTYDDTTYAPYYFASRGVLVIAKKICVYCEWQGGSTSKPLFW